MDSQLESSSVGMDEDTTKLLIDDDEHHDTESQQTSNKSVHNIPNKYHDFLSYLDWYWPIHADNPFKGLFLLLASLILSAVLIWLIIHQAASINFDFDSSSSDPSDHSSTSNHPSNILAQLNQWPDVSKIAISHESHALHDSHKQTRAQLDEWSEIEERLLPPQITASYRKHWLDKHVDLEFLHSINHALRAGQAIPEPPSHIVPLSPLARFFAGYTAFHSQALQNITESTRFLIHKPDEYRLAGLGNRMVSLASAFMLAALTNRVLIVDWEHSDDPFNVTDLFALPPIDWRISTVTDHFGDETVRTAMLSPIKHMTISQQWRNTFVKRDFQSLFCEHLESPEQAANKFLTLHSNQYFIPLMYQNPNFKPLIQSWGFDSGRLAAPILRYLFKLTPELQRKLDEYKASEFSDYMIGVQIRTGDGHAHSDDITSLAWRCGMFISDNLPTEWHKNNKVGYLLVTDSQNEVSMKARELLGDKPKLSMFRCPFGYTKEAVQCAAIEMFLLAETDDLVISKASTFGDVPRAMSMVQGMVLSQHMTCMRQPSVDPCFHYWQYARYSQCYSQTTMHQQEDINGFCVGRDRP